MADLNNFSFTGRLTKDAAIKQVNGKTIMEVDVANNIGYGQYAKTNWLKVKMWGDRCNNIAPIFKKGSLVAGSGELSTNVWKNNAGDNKTDIVITVTNLQILSSKKDDTNSEMTEDNEVTF